MLLKCDRGWMGRRCGQWRTCRYCRDRRQRDQAWVIRESIGAYGSPVILVTITAPGQDVLPFGEDGRCALRPLQEWASTMMERYDRLKGASEKRARRATGDDSPIVLASMWQLQPQRWAPHVHIVVAANDLGRAFAQALKELTHEYGFGFVDIEARGNKSGEAHSVAVGYYLAGYLPRVMDQPRAYLDLLPSRTMYVSRRLQRASGATMAVAFKLRRLWVFANKNRDVGLPHFSGDRERAWVYWWYRSNLRMERGISRAAIPRPWCYEAP